MRKAGGAGGGAARRFDSESAAPAGASELISSWVGVVVNAVSSVVADGAFSAGGASRPHSQSEEASDDFSGLSDSESQHDSKSPEGSMLRCM